MTRFFHSSSPTPSATTHQAWTNLPEIACVRIENWHIIGAVTDKGELQIRLQGNIYGHPHLKSGAIAWTSPVVSFSGNVVETEHRTYHLGNIESAFREHLYKCEEPAGGAATFESAYQLMLKRRCIFGASR